MNSLDLLEHATYWANRHSVIQSRLNRLHADFTRNAVFVQFDRVLFGKLESIRIPHDYYQLANAFLHYRVAPLTLSRAHSTLRQIMRQSCKHESYNPAFGGYLDFSEETPLFVMKTIFTGSSCYYIADAHTPSLTQLRANLESWKK